MQLLKHEISELLNKAEVAYVATSDKNGFPHLAIEKRLTILEDKYLMFNAWFCKKTVENLHINPKLVIAVYDPSSKEGVQFSGRVLEISDGAMLNGFSPEVVEEEKHIAQVESRLKIEIDEAFDFSTGPHSDKNIL